MIFHHIQLKHDKQPLKVMRFPNTTTPSLADISVGVFLHLIKSVGRIVEKRDVAPTVSNCSSSSNLKKQYNTWICNMTLEMMKKNTWEWTLNPIVCESLSGKLPLFRFNFWRQ